MASCFSLSYLGCFLPLVLLAYQLTPGKHRPKLLLAAGYLFFLVVSKKLTVYLLITTISVYGFGRRLAISHEKEGRMLEHAEKSERKTIKKQMLNRRRRILAAALLLNLGILIVLKYAGFFAESVNGLSAAFGRSFRLPVIRFALPIGISFYTLQAASYLFDVYRKVIPAETDFVRAALYMNFIPQMTEGPISRYSQIGEQLGEGKGITRKNLTFGMQRILYGLLKKLVVADRLNLMIETIFNNYETFDGGMIAVGMLCYTCQLYMDFSGAMDVALGTGEILGIRLPENFRQPFFSKSISEFWTRWHITLGTWFRDYLFYPLSMSKPLKKLTSAARKKLGNHFGPLTAGAISLFCVWFCNGLWHGAGWNYLLFGMYHFILILLGSMAEPLVKKLLDRLRIRRDSRPWRGMQIVRTFLLVNVGELLFRADGARAGLFMLKRMLTGFSLNAVVKGNLFTTGMDRADFGIAAVSVLLVFAVSLMHERGISVREKLGAAPLPVRWAAYYALILFVVIFGAYGAGYIPVDPIYANF